jgi:hypothetical protein
MQGRLDMFYLSEIICCELYTTEKLCYGHKMGGWVGAAMRLKKLDVAASQNTCDLFLCFSGDPEKVQFERDEGSPTLVQQSQPGVMLIKLSNSSLTVGQDKIGVLQQPWNIFSGIV